jgi:vitamin B12 transporter
MRYFSLAAAMVVTALPYSFNYAQVDDVTHSAMNEVVVTASLQPIELQQSANAITVISAQDIENSHATMVSDLLRDVPGVAVNRNGVLGSSTQLRMRGAEGNHVLVMIDGVEVNDAAQGDEFNWAHLPVTGIERIEIVRGPQSALWGSDAVAGVVNILTRKASQPLEGNAYSEVGNHGANHSGFGLGAGGQAYHVNISGSHVSADGENISRHGGEEDGYRNTTFNLNAGWQPLDNLSFSLSGRQTEGENEFDDIDSFVTGLPQDADKESEFRQRFGRLQTDLSLFDGHWQQRLAVSVSRHNNDEFTGGSLTGNTSSRKRQYSYLSALNWAENTQQLSFLAEHETEDFSQRGTAQPWGDPNQDRKRRTDSLALEYRITLWDDLTLAASVRHDDNSEFDNANTRRFEASYTLPNGDTRLRANYGAAVKSPTFTERFGFFTNFQGNPDLQPEESKSWEVGIDQTLLEGDLLLGLTYFRARLENEIDGFVFDPMTFAYTAENVDGTSERQGVEATLDAKLSATLGLKASYTYTDATQPESGLDRDIDETRRPRHLGSVSLNWSPTNQVNINLNAQYNGSQDDVFYPPWPQPSCVVKLDDYTLLNLSASYQMNKQLSFYTRLDNILDDDYEEVYGYQTLGFGAVFGVRYNFVP